MARIFFPDNRNHRRAFLAIWVEIKYAQNHFLPSRLNLAIRHELSLRTCEIVRAKMKKLGLIKRVSHFNPEHGYESGWTFCGRFQGCLADLRTHLAVNQDPSGRQIDERKDRNAMLYV